MENVLSKIKTKLMESKEQNSKINNQEINLLEKIIRVERDIILLNHLFPDAQKQIQNTLSILADSNQKMAIHFEQTKRYYERLDQLEKIIQEINFKLQEIDKKFIEIKTEIKESEKFINTIKKFVWGIFTSLLGIGIWYSQEILKK